MKTLMIVSGGDAPGINAALYHFTEIAAANGDTVVGAMESFAGLFDEKIVQLNPALLAPWTAQGGAYLTSSRTPALKTDDAGSRLRNIMTMKGIDNIVLLGGNGTLTHIPPLLEQWHIAHVSLPTTIDNDVPGTERTLGFDSACNYACAAVDGVIATARAMPGRIFTLETLGGDSGFIALDAAVAAGAHAVLVPEYEYTLEWLGERALQSIERDGFALIVLSEGAAGKDTLTNDLAQQTGVRVRDIRLGHAQRGSRPSHIDRKLAVNMTHLAHEALHNGARSGTVLLRDNQLVLHNGTIADFPKPYPDVGLYNRVNGLS